jgi:hypothetical protein
MKLKKRAHIFLLSILFSACSGISSEHIIGNYYITKIDYQDKNISLSYKINNESFVGVISPYISSIGFNDEYIIVKQKNPQILENSFNYFIIPLKTKINNYPDENKIGPLEYNTFLNKLKELNQIDKLSFTKDY